MCPQFKHKTVKFAAFAERRLPRLLGQDERICVRQMPDDKK